MVSFSLTTIEEEERSSGYLVFPAVVNVPTGRDYPVRQYACVYLEKMCVCHKRDCRFLQRAGHAIDQQNVR